MAVAMKPRSSKTTAFARKVDQSDYRWLPSALLELVVAAGEVPRRKRGYLAREMNRLHARLGSIVMSCVKDIEAKAVA